MIRNARRYNLKFFRRKGFKIPDKIYSDGKYRPISYPEELGIKTDFIGIFINDSYSLLKFKKDVKKIIDVGANVGFFSIASRCIFPNAVIHAYEPNYKLKEHLMQNSQEFNFNIFFEAVGGNEGYIDLEFRGDSNQTRISNSDNGKIKKISLDKAIERINSTVDILKLDCEGSEWEIIREAKNLDKINLICMEYHLFFDSVNHFDICSDLELRNFKILNHEFDNNLDYGLVIAENKSFLQDPT